QGGHSKAYYADGQSGQFVSVVRRIRLHSGRQLELFSAKCIKRRRSDDAPSQRSSLIGQRSALAHFADSDRTSRRVREVPNNGHGEEEAALVTSPVGTCSFP